MTEPQIETTIEQLKHEHTHPGNRGRWAYLFNDALRLRLEGRATISRIAEEFVRAGDLKPEDAYAASQAVRRFFDGELGKAAFRILHRLHRDQADRQLILATRKDLARMIDLKRGLGRIKRQS